MPGNIVEAPVARMPFNISVSSTNDNFRSSANTIQRHYTIGHCTFLTILEENNNEEYVTSYLILPRSQPWKSNGTRYVIEEEFKHVLLIC